jgi:signal peptidase I
MSDRLIGRSVPDDGSEGDPPTDADDSAFPRRSAAPGAHGAPVAQVPASDGTSRGPAGNVPGGTGSGKTDAERAAGGTGAGATGRTAAGESGSGTAGDATGRTAADETGSGTAGDRAAGGSAGGGAGGTAASPDETAAGGAGRTAPRSRRKRRSLWRELPLLILIALVIALVLKTFVIQAFKIPTGSMENTLEIGDKVLVNKLVYHFRSIQPGDIVVFDGAGSWDPRPPASRPSSDPLVRAYDATLRPLISAIGGLFGTEPGQTDYIKRVIGVPGDRVVCCNAQGLITVNGVALHEQSYLYPGDTPSDAPAGYTGRFRITVPPGRLWVLGDNRAVSADSRLHQEDPGDGTIPENEVIGRAFMIVWPPSRWRILPIPSTFLQPGIASRASAAALRPGAVLAEPAGPFLPLAAGLAGALPLTWLQRVARRRTTRARRAASG